MSGNKGLHNFLNSMVMRGNHLNNVRRRDFTGVSKYPGALYHPGPFVVHMGENGEYSLGPSPIVRMLARNGN